MSPGASFCSQASWASPPWEWQFTAPLEHAPAEGLCALPLAVLPGECGQPYAMPWMTRPAK